VAERKLLEFAFNKKMVTGDPATCIGDNLHELKNMRYRDTHVVSIGGMSKVNSSALPLTIVSAAHFRKSQPEESHVLVQGENSAGVSYIYTIDVEPPATGAFGGTALHTDATGAGVARFSEAPIGNMVVCNGAESLIWGGDELRVGSFLNYDPAGTFQYDYTDRVRNTLTDAANVATAAATSGGIDANTELLLHMDNDVLDASGSAHVVTNSGITFDSVNKVFGGYSALLNGTDQYCSVAHSADFSAAGGAFTVDMRVRPAALASNGSLYYQATDANRYFNLYHNNSGGVSLMVHNSAGTVVALSTPGGVLTVGTWAHVEFCESANDWRIFVDGKQKAYVSSAERALDYTGDLYIGRDGAAGAQYFSGNIDELRVSQTDRHTSAFEPQGTAYSSSTSTPWFYIGSTRPLDGFKLYIATPNTKTGVMTVSYWTGEWTNVSTLVDGTSSGGKSLVQTGNVTFSDTQTTAIVKSINGVVLYWYRVNVSSADAATSIYHVTVSAPMQPIVDLWDGQPRLCPSFLRNDGSAYTDYSGNIYENVYDDSDTTTFVNLGAMTTSQFVVAGFTERLLGMHVSIFSTKANTTANTVTTVKYWNGSAWVELTGVEDNTISGTSSFGTTGTITWSSAGEQSEFRTEPTKDVSLFYYKVSFSQTLSTDCHVFYITGIPAQKTVGAYTFPMLAHNRLWLLGELANERNSAICSATASPDIFSGDDTTKFNFGDDTPLVGGCRILSQFGSSLYNITVFFKESETWAVVGSTPEDWVQFMVSKTVGCVAPGTIAVATVTTAVPAGANTHVVIFQSADGVYAFDGRSILRISDDVKNYFDSTSTDCIPASMFSSSVAFYDTERAEYHLLLASGVGATALNVELVYDMRRAKWYKTVRPTGKELNFGCRATDYNGNSYIYGSYDGYLMLLEDGWAMDGAGFEVAARTGDISLEQGSMNTITQLRDVKLLGLATSSGGSVTVTHYADGVTSGTNLDATLPMTHSGYSLAYPRRGVNRQAVFHSLRFSATTSAGAPKQDWFGIGLQYEIVRTDS